MAPNTAPIGADPMLPISTIIRVPNIKLIQGDPYVMNPYSFEIRVFFEFYCTNGL